MASVGFRWLDILEKEFDKAFVDLDQSIGELDSEEPDIVYTVRQKLCTLSSCFAQLTHKAQTIFQNSVKIEAELVNMRAELVESKSKREILEQELHNLLLQLHSTQLSKLPKLNSSYKNDANLKPDINNIKKKLEDEMKKSPSHIIKTSITANEFKDFEFESSLVELKQLRVENSQLNQENNHLRNYILALKSEVYGAKLAAKYLDKELAGRIQQLQLLGREMRGDVRDKLWRQLESEILLQRHKTVVRECRRNSLLNSAGKNSVKSDLTVPIISEQTEHFGDVRTVVIKRKLGQGLGISITGGREHGVPILISELEQNGPAALSGQLYIGDAILSVNNRDLRQACHKEAVEILKQHSEECRLLVQYIAGDDSDNSLEEDGFHFRFFDNDFCDSLNPANTHLLNRGILNTPTAPRTPESSCQSGDASSAADPTKPFQVSPEIQKVIDSLKSNNMANFNLPFVNDNSKDILTGNVLETNLNNEINLNTTTKYQTDDLILLDNDYKKPNLNCSSNSLNSENFSSPMQTSTDVFLDSEMLSTDLASNDSQSPKNNDPNFNFGNKDFNTKRFDEIYASNETFFNTKSDQSLLNSSCESSPVHKINRDYKKTKKYKSKKYFGVKTLQNIFNKHDGYSDISSNASDEISKEESPKKEIAKESEVDDAATTYKYKTILPETSPQFEENIHNFLSEIFMKNFQAPECSESNATTSKVGTKRYLRVGKALRLCTNEENANVIAELEQRREKLLARYVYNSNSLSADGEGNPEFGTPV